MAEDDFAAQIGHFQQARLHGGARMESNSHPSYNRTEEEVQSCGATPKPKYLAARIVSSRPVFGRAVPCRYWIMQVLCHVLLYWIWFRAGSDCAAEIDFHMLASPFAVKSTGLEDRNWRNQNLAFYRVIWSACAVRL